MSRLIATFRRPLAMFDRGTRRREAGVVAVRLPFVSIIKEPSIIQRNAVLRPAYGRSGTNSTTGRYWWSCGALLTFVLETVFIAAIFHLQFTFVLNHYVRATRAAREERHNAR